MLTVPVRRLFWILRSFSIASSKRNAQHSVAVSCSALAQKHPSRGSLLLTPYLVVLRVSCEWLLADSLACKYISSSALSPIHNFIQRSIATEFHHTFLWLWDSPLVPSKFTDMIHLSLYYLSGYLYRLCVPFNITQCVHIQLPYGVSPIRHLYPLQISFPSLPTR